MCGIVGGVGRIAILPLLLDGLKKLEYRGYDSAGVLAARNDGRQILVKESGKTTVLREAVGEKINDNEFTLGIAHTRWATHGKVSKENAHPHCAGEISLVHNGIIENHAELRQRYQLAGIQFSSETDSEVLAVAIEDEFKRNPEITLIKAVQNVTQVVTGAYGLAVTQKGERQVVVARSGSPMAIGLADEGNYVASDPMAINAVTEKFIFLEEGDTAVLSENKVTVYDCNFSECERSTVTQTYRSEDDGKNGYETYMQKEIAEQPAVIGRLVRSHLTDHPGRFRTDSCLPAIARSLKEGKCQAVHIVACGTSYHASLVARYYFEHYLNLPTTVEIASEYRYRTVAKPNNTAFICVSQSGETADTLAALKKARGMGYMSIITLCNVKTSSMVRESDHAIMLQAGTEVGVASTNAFTTQLTAFMLLTMAMMDDTHQSLRVLHNDLMRLPADCETMLNVSSKVASVAAPVLDDATSCLFLGRGEQAPIAMEGALKLKELSYIHAEAYAAGELKHGPLALIDKTTPVIVTAPNDAVVDKLASNIEEVNARGGRFVVFAAPGVELHGDNMQVITLPEVPLSTAAITYAIPLQQLSYFATVRRGNDVDQPRNLAKSVTTE